MVNYFSENQMLRGGLMARSNKKGRPESFHAEYFSHSVHEKDELMVMYRKYKYEGYTAYFRLLEQVAKADFHRLELENETQELIFQINMGVRQEVIDFLIQILLQMGLMNADQWEKNKTIYLDKFASDFKKLWYDRGKTVPDADGRFIDLSSKGIKDNKVSSTGKGYNRIENNKVNNNTNNTEQESNNDLLSVDEYKKLFPNKNVDKSIDKYFDYHPKPSHASLMKWLENEEAKRLKDFKTNPKGYIYAWCSKCGKRAFPNNMAHVRKGSECCGVEYLDRLPKN